MTPPCVNRRRPSSRDFAGRTPFSFYFWYYAIPPRDIGSEHGR